MPDVAAPDEQDRQWMRRAIQLAWNGWGRRAPLRGERGGGGWGGGRRWGRWPRAEARPAGGRAGRERRGGRGGFRMARNGGAGGAGQPVVGGALPRPGKGVGEGWHAEYG